MIHATLRWALYFTAILVAGPIAASLIAPLRGPGGATEATVLTSTAPLAGILAIVVAAAIAAVMGVVTARLVQSMRAGMIAAGLVLIWVAFESARMDDMVRAWRSAQPLWLAAGEGIIVGALLIGVAALVVLVGGRGGGDDEAGHAHGAKPVPIARRLFGSNMAESIMAVGAGVLAGGAAAFFVAVTPLKGQAIAAAIVGSLTAAAAGRLIEHRAPLVLLMIPPAILAVLGPALGALLAGAGIGAGSADSGIVGTVYRGGLFPLAYITPLDWLAGALPGVPLGVAWAASMVEKRSAPAPA